jgi:hypothetical protein
MVSSDCRGDSTLCHGGAASVSSPVNGGETRQGGLNWDRLDPNLMKAWFSSVSNSTPSHFPRETWNGSEPVGLLTTAWFAGSCKNRPIQLVFSSSVAGLVECA